MEGEMQKRARQPENDVASFLNVGVAFLTFKQSGQLIIEEETGLTLCDPFNSGLDLSNL